MYMPRKLLNGKSWLLAGSLPVQQFVDKGSDTSKAPESFYNASTYKTGWDRLYLMYSIDQHGSFSHELMSVYGAAFVGTFIGATYGGYITARAPPSTVSAAEPKGTVLKRKSYAPPTPQGNITANIGREMFRLGWRVGLCSGSLVLVSTTVSTWRGKSGVIEYVIVGSILGTILRMKHGLKSALVGGLAGTAMGLVGGCVAYGVQRQMGGTTEEIGFWQHEWKDAQLSGEKVKKFREQEEEMMKLRTQKK